MPAYGTLAIPSAPYKGDIATLWNAETPVTGDASERIAVSYAADGNPAYFSVDFIFSGSPGAFEINIQEADTDTTADFIGAVGGAITTATAQSDGTYRKRVDLTTPVTANFLRFYMKTQTANAVTLTAKITRQ